MNRMILAATLLLLAPNEGVASANQLAVRVVIEKDEFLPGEPIAVWIEYKNETDVAIAVPHPREFPPLVVKDHDGRSLRYEGEIVDRAPTVPRYIIIDPKTVHVEWREADTSFPIQSLGTYSVLASIDSLDPLAPGNEKLHEKKLAYVNNSIESKPVQFEVIDTDDPASRLVVERSKGRRSFGNCFFDLRKALSELGEETKLCPYLELYDVTVANRPRTAEALRRATDKFFSRFPNFDQPGYALAQLGHMAAAIEGNEALSYIREEAIRRLPGKPVIEYLRTTIVKRD